tara:strand:+ start:1892 stop:2599 length:708 start_codon:yes stop_codon:yes gene_type:complete
MWFDILKDSKQVSRTMGSIDWENETIPETEDDDCKKWLQEYYDILNKYRDLGGVFSIKMDKIPNELACKIKEWYSSSGELDESESTIWNNPIDGLDVSPFFFIGDEWYYEFGLAIQNTETSEILFQVVITRYYKNNEPEIVLGGSGTQQDKDLYLTEWEQGKNTWTKRMVNCLKEFIKHVKPKNDPKEYILHNLASQWKDWWTSHTPPDTPDSRLRLKRGTLDDFIEVLEEKYWK